jgi:hypothetical protein
MLQLLFMQPPVKQSADHLGLPPYIILASAAATDQSSFINGGFS